MADRLQEKDIMLNPVSNSEIDSFCGNCSHKLEPKAKFCSNCGQDTHTKKVTFHHYFIEFLEGTIHFDEKIWRTIKGLFVSPGLIIKNYNNNKRARYVPPIRLYIFVSFCYFLLIANVINKASTAIGESIHNKPVSSKFQIDILTNTVVSKSVAQQLLAINYISEKQIDSVLAVNHVQTDFINTRFLKQYILLKEGEKSSEILGHRYLSDVSKTIFVLIPLFAFLIWVFCGPKLLYFSETLTFSLYFHSMCFMLLSVNFILTYLFKLPNAVYFVLGIIFIYLIYAIKIAFNKNWFVSFIQSSLVLLFYFFMLIVGFFVTLFTSVVY